MNLKTLKDISKEFHSEHLLDNENYEFGRLKQEAIKWVENIKGSINAHLSRGLDRSAFGLMEQERWIMKFFNLTEEDLK